MLNRNDASTPMAQADRLIIGPTQVQANGPPGGAGYTGIWAMVRDELINRPCLRIALPNEDTHALVTRLRRSLDGLSSQLNLYFATGMEMQLDRV